MRRTEREKEAGEKESIIRENEGVDAGWWVGDRDGRKGPEGGR